MGDIRFLAEFVDSDEEVVVPEDITAANFAILADDDAITRNRPRRPRLMPACENVLGPVGGLVDWLIENWGPILWETHTPFKKGGFGDDNTETPGIPGVREAAANWAGYVDLDTAQFAEWQHRHLLGHACSDLALPSIVIIPEDRHVVIAVDRLPSAAQASVEFLGPDDMPRGQSVFVCRKIDFRQTAKEFIEKTLERTESIEKFNYWANWLKERWLQAQSNEAKPRNQLTWMLGELSAKRVEEITKDQPGLANGMQQMLLDCPIVTQRTELRPIENLISDLAIKPDSSLSSKEIPGWRNLVPESVSMSMPEFAQGYQLARLVRQKMSLEEKPIRDLSKTLERLDVKLEDDFDSSLFRVAVCAPSHGRAHIVPSSMDERMRTPTASRFAIASALGRLIWQSRLSASKPICAAQGDYAMLSQSRRANAFAAEFLLPREAILGVSPDSPELWNLAARYGISPPAARWHVHNVGNAGW